MARQIDVPDFYAIRQKLSLPVIEPSMQNINQNHSATIGNNFDGAVGIVNDSYVSDTDHAVFGEL